MRTNLFLILAIICCLYGCSKKVNDSEKTVFRYNEKGGINSLDPAYAGRFEDTWVISQIFNGLVEMNNKFEVQPAIASSWDISDDGLIYTFHLRNNVFFHDHELFSNGKGRKVVASDFVNSYYRLTDQDVASSGGWLLKNIDISEKSNHVGFIAENDSTFKIFLKQPSPGFLANLTMAYFSVIPYEIVKHYGKEFRRNPIGTGPFKFKIWKDGIKMVLSKNENYYEFDGENRLPYLDAVSISFGAEPERNVEFLEFIKGNLDFYSGALPASFKDEVFYANGDLTEKYKGKFRFEKQPYLKTDYLGILVDESYDIVKGSPYSIKKVRQAINYSINKKEFINFVRGGVGKPADAGFVPRGLPSFSKEKVHGYSYNPEKAKQLLREAGFPLGEGLPQLVLGMTKTEKVVMEYIQNQISEVGIDLKLDINPVLIHSHMVATAKQNFFWKNWVADYPDAENFLSLFYSGNTSINYTRFKNDAFDRLYEKAQVELNTSKRYAYYHKMDSIIIEEAPVIPLFYDEVIRLVQNNVEGLETNPLNSLILKRVRIVK